MSLRKVGDREPEAVRWGTGTPRVMSLRKVGDRDIKSYVPEEGTEPHSLDQGHSQTILINNLLT